MPKYLEFAAKGIRNLNWDGIRDTPIDGCMVYDLRNLPIRGIQDETYNGIYSEHFMEHLERDEGLALMKECLRILKPGGVLRTVWPPHDVIDWLRGSTDLSDNDFVKRYYNRYVVRERFPPKGFKADRIQDYVAAGLEYQKGEHKYLWGITEMRETLKSLGYVNIRQPDYGQSRIMDFCGIETQGVIRQAHSAVIEAEKPWA